MRAYVTIVIAITLIGFAVSMVGIAAHRPELFIVGQIVTVGVIVANLAVWAR